MSIDIRIHGDAADDELRSLYEWLLSEPEILHHAHPKLVSKEPTGGEMGATLDVITLVTTSAIALPGMIDVIRTWHGTRRRKPQMTIERGDLKVTFSDIDVDPHEITKILASTGEK